MEKKKIILIIGMILLVLLIWGLIGSANAAEISINCDVGIGKDGSVFCWKWHQNVLGDIAETIDQVFNS